MMRSAGNRRLARCSAAIAALLALGPMTGANSPLGSPANGEAADRALPKPPANGVMGFVVSSLAPTVVSGTDACPNGTVPRLRDAWLETLPAEERARLKLKENIQEFERGWQSYAFGQNGTNICSQPEMFDHPLIKTVQSPYALGLNLDEGAAPNSTCAHETFTSPTGEKGIDNQVYRAMGCTLEWRGVDGSGGDITRGSKSFHTSGEWTQVLLLRGVDSLQNDSDVEVIYANTADRPNIDNNGNFLTGVSFTVNNTPPRYRNVLHGRIVNGVLTTRPQDIVLTETWGQGGARDIRGARTKWEMRQGRLQLAFQPDGSLRGLVGGYRPIPEVYQAMALGGAGTALVAGIDCAAYHATLLKLADGVRDSKTGRCTGVSSAEQMSAVPAFINDVPSGQRTAAR
jgi:hypothetical protein